MSVEDTIEQKAVMADTSDLREIGRPIVTAWRETRDVKTLGIGDAANLMERVGAAIEAERWALQSQLAQVTAERDELREQLKASFRELLNEQDSNRNFRQAAVDLCKRSASNWRTTGGRSHGDYARACREKANLMAETATQLEQLQ